jgi:hypothetical protein
VKPPARFLARFAPAFALLLLAGCWEERVVWSPDGNHAAVITKEGLHLCGADGSLSPLLAPGAYRAAWLPDSQRLVIASSRELKDYAALAAALGPERTRALVAKTEAFWQRWEASPTDEFGDAFDLEDDLGAIIVCLRERHHDDVVAKLRKDKKEQKDIDDFEAAVVGWNSLAVARLAGDRLEFGRPLFEGLAGIRDIRPAPSGAAIAFVAPAELSPNNDAALQLFVVPSDGASPPAVLATHVAFHPDWTPDSRALVYLQAEGSGSGKPDRLRLGALVERNALDEKGRVHLDDESPRELAGLIFQDENRVRCLRDGRVLFDAAEFHLPLAGSDHSPREQLFAIDRMKEKSAVVPLIPKNELDRLPNPLAFFYVSPDETQVLFGGGSDVSILRLADGRVEHFAVQMVSKDDGSPPLPMWRRAGEFTYLKSATPRNELILRRGEMETVLSRTWPDAALLQLIK